MWNTIVEQLEREGNQMRQYFKFIYLLSGRYRVTYTAKIIAWENEIVKIRDRDNKEHTLKEKYIQSMRSTNPHTKSEQRIDESTEYEQQDLFAEVEDELEFDLE